MVLVLLTAMVSSCLVSSSETFTGEQLQALVNKRFMSPQIRQLKILSPLIDVQFYLETPTLTLRGDHRPLGFAFKGKVDADVFSEFIDGNVTDPVSVQLEGFANLEYRVDDHAFYFSDIILESANIDLNIAIIQTLISDQLKGALKQELGSLPIIPLDESTDLYKQLKNLPAAVYVENGKLIIKQNIAETAVKTD